MAEELIFENIIKLQTPVGYFSVISGDEMITFSVKRNGIDWPSGVTDDEGNMIGEIHTDTNYCIVIDADKLQTGKTYIVKFVASTGCKWEFCDSDEHTTCYDSIIDSWAVGIGALDPNDQEKEDQAWKYSKTKGFLQKNFIQEQPSYDESNFVQYTVEVLDTYDGYRFKLFDHSLNRIIFEVAWVKIDKFPSIEYEGALGLWLC